MTRTVHFGTPREIEVEVYTRLLKGCIDLASTKFPKGYTMQNLEVIIRGPLFRMGLQYGHGSTHGIGHFLAVHECEYRVGRGGSRGYPSLARLSVYRNAERTSLCTTRISR